MYSTFLRGCTVLALGCLLLACSEASAPLLTGGPARSTAADPTIEVSGRDTINALQELVLYTAVVRNESGDVNPGAQVDWYVRRVNRLAPEDDNGLYRSLLPGEAWVKARYRQGGVSYWDSLRVIVRQVPETLVLSVADPNLPVGDTIRVQAAATDSNGIAINGFFGLTWLSSDADVLRVQGRGRVYAAAEGSVTISAVTDNGVDDDIAMTGVAPRPPEGVIAFSSAFETGDGSSNIYTINADGSNLVRLTDLPDSELWPAWSPNGTRIAFSNDASDLFVMNADGSGVGQLTNTTAMEHMPSWSRDGARIAYRRSGLWVMNADGSDQHDVEPLPESGQAPSWTPDGLIVYRMFDPGTKSEIAVLDPDAPETPRVRLTETPTKNELSPEVSPDGRFIAYVRLPLTGSGERELCIRNRNGGVSTLLRGNLDSKISWSPDGRHIALAVGNRISILNVATRQIVAQIGPNASREPAWKPE